MRSLMVCSLVLGAELVLGAPAESPSLSASDVIARAIEVQKTHEEDGNEVRFDYRLVSVTEKLDQDGDVESVEERLYRSHHIDGVAYERLVMKDGRELTDKEKEKEEEREEKFREKLAKDEARHNDNDERVAFDEELVSRYDFELAHIRALAGRECYVLSYEPKSGKLPSRRTIDRALNKAAGTIWIDAESFEIARLEFELQEKVRLWWGVMGSVSSMSGAFQRQPVDDHLWVPEQFDFYMKGRMLFRSIHVRQRVMWNDFEPRRNAVASNED